MSVDPRSFEPDCNRFDNEDECIRALFLAKWPDGFICPRCEHRQAYLISTRRLPLYECSSCRTQTSLIAHTIMEGSRTPLHLWFQAIHLHSLPRGINATQLSHMIGVTYKTAWLICHKLRQAMSCMEDTELLTGLVRATDTIIYKHFTPTFDIHPQEQSLVIGSSENDQGEITQIKIQHQTKGPLRNQFASPHIQPFLLRYVDPQAMPHAILSPRRGPNRNVALLRISKEVEWWLAGTFNGIGPKHLQRYLDQYVYKWNRRNRLVFTELLQGCAITPTITYPMLTAGSARPLRSARHPASWSKIAC
jgi:hypothetical protein